MKDKDVRARMDELFSYHIEENQISSLIIKRSFKNYIDKFDPLRIYLLEKEIDPYLNSSDQMLQDAVVCYNNDDLYYYQNLHQIMQRSIQRARKWRKEMRSDMEANADKYKLKLISSKQPFSKDLQELKSRQHELMMHSVKKQEQGFNYFISQDDRNQMFAFYEKRMREFEDLYITENFDNTVSYDQARHFLVLHTLKSLAQSLDAHTAYYSPDEARAMRTSLKKGYYGIGIYLGQDYSGIKIQELIDGGPAAKTGKVKSGDAIIAIDGQFIEGLSIKQVLKLMQGAEGNPVSLLLERQTQDGDSIDIEVDVIREKVILDDRRIEISYEALGDGIVGTIKLYSFYANKERVSSAKDIKNALKELKSTGKLKGLVLDLRENSGGFLSQAVEVTGLFISSGVIVMSKFSDGNMRYFRDLDGTTYYDGPLVVLTSKMSASAAEIVAGALQDYGAAIVVGDNQTWGKGSVQYQTITKSNAPSVFKVTIGRYYTVSGASGQIEGVKSDIVVPTEYYEEQIGEEFLDNPLNADQIEPAFNDSLKDLHPKYKDTFVKYYIPTVQEKRTEWTSMLPILKKNSHYRLEHNEDFQVFLTEVHPDKYQLKKKEKPKLYESMEIKAKNYGAEDLQLTEAINIIKDMVYIKEERRPKSKVAGR